MFPFGGFSGISIHTYDMFPFSGFSGISIHTYDMFPFGGFTWYFNPYLRHVSIWRLYVVFPSILTTCFHLEALEVFPSIPTIRFLLEALRRISIHTYDMFPFGGFTWYFHPHVRHVSIWMPFVVFHRYVYNRKEKKTLFFFEIELSRAQLYWLALYQWRTDKVWPITLFMTNHRLPLSQTQSDSAHDRLVTTFKRLFFVQIILYTD